LSFLGSTVIKVLVAASKPLTTNVAALHVRLVLILR